MNATKNLSIANNADSKTCPKCARELPATKDYFYKDKRYGLASYCIDCQKAKSKKRHYAKWDHNKDLYLKRIYGISLDDYNYFMVMQSDRCAICSTDDKGGKKHWYVDHDHETGVVRGLLCNDCNLGLGKFKDCEYITESAAAYMKAHISRQESVV